MPDKSSAETLAACLKEFRTLKKDSDAAIAQIDDASLFKKLNPQQNSIAVIMRHMSGNMVSRWTDFRTTDGDKPNRNREGEFAETQQSRDELLKFWERGWKVFFDAIESIEPDELTREIKIRNEPNTIIAAVLRQVSHYSYHVGQILLLAKHWRGEGWKYLSIAPGQSEAFNEKMRKKN